MVHTHDNTFQRKELKYLLTPQQYAAVRQSVAPYLQPDFYAGSTVHNLYCDSVCWELARRSIEKPAYKEKLRLRGYGAMRPESPVFLELKKKYKGIVYKRRFACSLQEAMAYLEHGAVPHGADQVLREIDYTVQHYGLRPAMYLAYDRLAFCGREDSEFRVTFDGGIRSRLQPLSFLHGSGGAPLLANGMMLMEIKAAQAMPHWMLGALREAEAYPASFSKYGQIYSRLTQQHACVKKENTLCFKAS